MSDERAAPQPQAAAPASEAPPVLEPELIWPETVEVREEQSLAQRAEASLIDSLQRIENYEAVILRRGQMLDTLRRVALARTRPQDWILFKAKDGSIVALLGDSGCNLVAELYGVVIEKVWPLAPGGGFDPQQIQEQNGHYSLRCWIAGFSRVTGAAQPSMEASIRDDEEFTGRKTDDNGGLTTKRVEGGGALMNDLRATLYTRARSKLIRVLTGCTRVPVEEIERAWSDSPSKSLASARHGGGFSAGERASAAKAGPSGLAQARAALADELLRRVGDDPSAVSQVVLDITKGKGFKGFDDIGRLTKGWQFDKAMKQLAAHPVFGDAAQPKKEPGEDADEVPPPSDAELGR